MRPVIRESYERLRPEQLAEVERQLGFSFPIPYRIFLGDNNGGYPVPDVFKMPNGNVEMVDRFLGIRPGEHNDLTRYADVYRERVPSEIVPIAHDAGGNLICIGVRGAHVGKVFFWDHEREGRGGRGSGL